MALPVIEAEGNKEVTKVVTEIGQAIFKRTGMSISAAAAAVVPDIPEMVKEITEDLRAGPVNRFSQGIDKLDKLIQNLGVNISDYSKDLGEFLKNREQNVRKNEDTLNKLRADGIIASLNDIGEISILTKGQIQQQETLLESLNTQLADQKKRLVDLGKTRQKDGDARSAQERTILSTQKQIERLEQDRINVLTTLNKTEEQEGESARVSFRDRTDSLIDKYVPDGLRDIGSAFTEGLTAPLTAIKELGMTFGSMLKPLRALPKLFKGLMAGLLGALAGLLPFILIAAAVVAGLFLLKEAIEFVKEKFDENREALVEFKDKVLEIPKTISDFFDEQFKNLKLGFDKFVEDVKLIPGKISDFFSGIFNSIQNFFIDAINSVITLINKVKPGKDIELLENVPLPPSPTENDVGTNVPVDTAAAEVPSLVTTGDAAAAEFAGGDTAGGEFSSDIVPSDKTFNFEKSRFKGPLYENRGLTPDSSSETNNVSIIDQSNKQNIQNNSTSSGGLSGAQDTYYDMFASAAG